MSDMYEITMTQKKLSEQLYSAKFLHISGLHIVQQLKDSE